MTIDPAATLPPPSRARLLVTLEILAQPVGSGAAPKVGIWPENVSFTTYAGAANGAFEEGIEMCRPEPSWVRPGRLM